MPDKLVPLKPTKMTGDRSPRHLFRESLSDIELDYYRRARRYIIDLIRQYNDLRIEFIQDRRL
jgi:hypothetical protein